MILTQRRAVAPIIATLLMVAVAVIGGMMVFVFAQGFFEDTQLVAPTIEQLEIWGYNATDSSTNLGTHTGNEVTLSTLTQTNRLAENDEIAVFLRNNGGNEVLIAEVQVYGVALTAESTSSPGALTDVNPGEWVMSVNGQDECGCQILKAGQEATILIGWDEDINGAVKVGRPMLVKIETGSGATFTKQVVNGRDVG